MTVIGLTDELRGDAEQQCSVDFRAWLGEVNQGTWGSWEELQKHYPKISRTVVDEAHFPLIEDGTGVRAMVIFKMQLMILGGIAPSPVTSQTSQRRRISLPQSK